MPQRFLGFDHLDVRVRSLALVEAFYDRLMPELGLPRKTVSYVDPAGEWHEPDGAHAYNTVEYFEARPPGELERFIGFIEDPQMRPVRTRVAFALDSRERLVAWEARLRELGAHNVERDEDFVNYPAVFFEDPAGTRLELCARRPKV